MQLYGKGNSIINTLIYSSGFVKITKGAIKENLYYKNPKWDNKELFIPKKSSPLLKANNGIDTIGLVFN